MRPSWTVSVASRMPLMVVDTPMQVVRVKGNTFDPPAYVRVSVKLIGVPHANPPEVLTWNGTLFTEVAFSAAFGYAEVGCVIVTPGVVVESTPEIVEPRKQPLFSTVTFKLLHSFGSMTELPFPPEVNTVLD